MNSKKNQIGILSTISCWRESLSGKSAGEVVWAISVCALEGDFRLSPRLRVESAYTEALKIFTIDSGDYCQENSV